MGEETVLVNTLSAWRKIPSSGQRHQLVNQLINSGRGGAMMTTFTQHWQQLRWDDVSMRIHSQTAADIERALTADNSGPEEMMTLLSPAALAYLEPLAQQVAVDPPAL